MKTEDEVDGDETEKQYREQNEQMFKYRDKLQKVDGDSLNDLLQYNDQEIPSGRHNVRH